MRFNLRRPKKCTAQFASPAARRQKEYKSCQGGESLHGDVPWFLGNAEAVGAMGNMRSDWVLGRQNSQWR